MIEHNPVSIEKALLGSVDDLVDAAKVCDRLLTAKQDAEREYDYDFSVAFMAHNGPQTEKKHAATIATIEQRKRFDVEEAAYKYAVNRARALEVKISALQSIKKSVDQAYQSGVSSR